MLRVCYSITYNPSVSNDVHVACRFHQRETTEGKTEDEDERKKGREGSEQTKRPEKWLRKRRNRRKNRLDCVLVSLRE